ncbi:MAG: hypothetical protein WD407_01220 [Rhodospirillales bacterium]
MKIRGIGLFLFFVTLGAAPVLTGALSGAMAAEPSALRLGYCASDFDVCYNACRISNPGLSFSDDQARVACGQTCLQQRYRCEGRVGAVPAPHQPVPPRMAAPTPAAPVTAPSTEAPRLAQPRSLSVRQAPAATAGDAPDSSSAGQPAARAEPQKKESGIWKWIKPRERKESVIPGKF